MPFRMSCPKCASPSVWINQEQRLRDMVMSCRCGWRLYGEKDIEKEHAAQEHEWLKTAGDRAVIQQRREEIAAQKREQKAKIEAALRAGLEHKRQQKAVADEKKRQEIAQWMETIRANEASQRRTTTKPKPKPTTHLPYNNLIQIAAHLVRVRRERVGIPAKGSQWQTPENPDDQCALPSCSSRPQEKSKYCSRSCSNKNARLRHKARSKKTRKATAA